MESLDLLEKRIEALEVHILPKKRNFISGSRHEVVSDLLLQTHTMISSALSCREAITSILQHMTTINEYLDPCNGENELEVEAKRHYLLELYPELMDTVKLIGTFEGLTPYVDSGNILKMTELSDKLERLATHKFNVLWENQQVANDILTTLQQYNDITTTIKVLFGQLDKAITDLEVALMPKFTTEE